MMSRLSLRGAACSRLSALPRRRPGSSSLGQIQAAMSESEPYPCGKVSFRSPSMCKTGGLSSQLVCFQQETSWGLRPRCLQAAMLIRVSQQRLCSKASASPGAQDQPVQSWASGQPGVPGAQGCSLAVLLEGSACELAPQGPGC